MGFKLVWVLNWCGVWILNGLERAPCVIVNCLASIYTSGKGKQTEVFGDFDVRLDGYLIISLL